MRIVKLIGAFVAVVAFSAIAVASASAAEILWKWLPGSVGETFTAKTGKLTWQVKGGSSIACKSSSISLTGSELLKEGSTSEKDATLALAILDVEGCTFAGIAINSVGDKSGTILIHLEIHNCMIKKADFGSLFKYLELKLEVPALKETIVLRGSFVGLVEGKEGEKLLTFKLNIKQKEGVQEFEKCEGGEKDTLETSQNGGTFVQTGEEAAEATLSFDMTKDKEGEELMEK